MGTRGRAMVVALSIVVVSVAGAAPAWAAPPANDTLAGAVVVGALPFTHTQSTTGAADSDDFETGLNDFCGAPAVEHGVWFELTPAADGFVAADVTESDYSAGVMVFAGDPTPESLLTCGPGQVAGPVTGGVTHYLLVFGDGLTEETSGTLVLHVEEASPPPEVSLTVDPVARFDQAGNVLLSGTVTCTSEEGTRQLFELFGELSQRVGRFRVEGFFDTFSRVRCSGRAVPWSVAVAGENGLFRGGKAATVAIGVACNEVGCGAGFVEATVRLRGGTQ